MTNRVPILISTIVYIFALIISSSLFFVSTSCVNIIGDGYAMGTDPKPVVISQSCSHWRLAKDTDDFATHFVLSAIIALTLSIITWGAVWILRMKNINLIKKFGLAILWLIFTIIGFIVTSAIVAAFSGGTIMVDQVTGMISVLLCLMLSLIGSMSLTQLISKHRFID